MTKHGLRSLRGLACALVLMACGGDDDATTGADGPTSTSVTTSTTGTTGESETSGTSTTVATSATSSVTEDSGVVDDGTTSTSETTTTNASSESSTGTTGEQELCTSDMACPDGQSCRLSMCCDGVGFCVPPGTATCGGFVGTPCRGNTVCVLDSCVADGDGVCLAPEDASVIDDAQPECWSLG